MERPTKRSRENKRLLDSLGGGRETTTPRQARTARKLINHSNSSSSINNNNNLNNNLNNLNNINNNLNNINNNLNNHIKQINIKQINIKQINNKHSDSSLSELSDSLEQQQPSPSKTFTTNQLQKQTPSSSLPSTPTSNHSSMKQQPILKNHPSLRRKTIIKRSHSSFARHHHHIKSNYHRSHRNSRKLTEDQKREIEKTRIKLLKNLEKEEDLIKSSQHPILISLEKNVRIGKEIKLNQAREKLNRLINYLNLLNFERQQRIWETWIDTKMRLRNEMIVDCQIRLNRAPFEFLISNDTTNLRAIFHLTSTPAAVYNRPKLSISQVKKTIAEAAGAAGVDTTGQTRHAGSATQGRVVNSSWAGSGMMEESCTKSKEEEIRNGSSKSKRLIKSRKTQSNRRVVNHDHHDIDPNILELVDEGLQFDEEQEVEKNKIPFLESVDLIDGLIHQKIRCHNVWKLSNHAVDHDLNLIKTSTRF